MISYNKLFKQACLSQSVLQSGPNAADTYVQSPWTKILLNTPIDT